LEKAATDKIKLLMTITAATYFNYVTNDYNPQKTKAISKKNVEK